ncbi:MAG: glycosyltransferase family 2 protein [Planctomycetota bacterium]
MRVVVVIPALNEERGIGKVLADLPSGELLEVIVVDNGSSDRTAEVARSLGARVIEEAERGYGAACLAGIAAAKECDVVAFVDADYSDFPGELPELLAPIERGEADLVIGSRMIQKESRAALLPQARFGNWLSGLLLSRLFGAKVTDLGPFRAIRSAALRALEMDDRRFGWTVQMQARAFARGFRVREVPVSYRPRIGKSKISGTLMGSFRAGMTILWTIGAEFLRRRRPRITHESDVTHVPRG